MNSQTAEQFGVQAQMFTAVYPKLGKPWVVGIHQCSHARIWTNEEQKLSKEVGRRTADAVSSTLALQEAREAEGMLHTLVDNIPEMIARFDREGRHLFVNRTVESCFGIRADEIIGKTGMDLGLVCQPPAEEMHKLIQRAFDEGKANTVQQRWITSSGIRYADALHFPEKDETGRVVSVLGVAHDITEQRGPERN